MSEMDGKASSLAVVILAAGKGVRMKSNLPKVLHRLCGLTLLERALRAGAALKPKEYLIVIGAGEDLVRAEIERIASNPLFRGVEIKPVLQAEQLGTGHAVQVALPYLTKSADELAILPGDAPLLTGETLKASLGMLRDEKAQLVLLSTIAGNPSGFGRVLRGKTGEVTAVVEHRDCTKEQLLINEINSAIYVGKREYVERALSQALNTDNAQREYYLTDIVGWGVGRGEKISAFVVQDPEEVLGANSREELSQLEARRRAQINAQLMRDGVTLEDPAATYVDEDVEVEADCFIGAGTRLYGKTKLAAGVIIEGDTLIRASAIGAGSVVKLGCYLTDSTVGADCQVGPFAHLRPASVLHDQVHVGNFVETKKSELKRGAKANHLSYLGDSTIGEKVNIGAGTITCNYDGYFKHQTVIGDRAFIGSNANLVAPVNVGAGAIVGAGSTITADVPADALAIERAEQHVKPGWAAKKRSELEAKKKGASS